MQIKVNNIVATIAALHIANARRLGNKMPDTDELKKNIKEMLDSGREDELFSPLSDEIGIDIAAIRERLLTDYRLATLKINKAEEKRRKRHERNRTSKTN